MSQAKEETPPTPENNARDEALAAIDCSIQNGYDLAMQAHERCKSTLSTCSIMENSQHIRLGNDRGINRSCNEIRSDTIAKQGLLFELHDELMGIQDYMKLCSLEEDAARVETVSEEIQALIEDFKNLEGELIAMQAT